jgi:hypothetical protein
MTTAQDSGFKIIKNMIEIAKETNYELSIKKEQFIEKALT